MATIDEFGKKLGAMKNKAAQKTQNLAETVKLNGEIAALERNIDSVYTMIGKKFYALHTDCEEPEFDDMMNAIKTYREKLDELQTRLKNIGEMRFCPQCGARLDMTNTFCTSCGRMIEKE